VKITLRYIQGPWVDKKTGRVYAFFRRRGCPRLRLPGIPGSAEFLAGYKAALNGEPVAAAVAIERAVQSTFAGAIKRYIEEVLPKRVKEEAARRQSSTLRNFVKKCDISERPLIALDVDYVNRCIKDAETPGIARTWLITVREFCKWAVEQKLIDADPTAGIVIKLPKSDGHATWSEEQIAQFEARWPLGTRERLLFALLLHTGQRCSDVIKLGPASIVNGAFPIKQQKTGAKVRIPVLPELAAAIAACEVVGFHTFLATKTGKPLNQRDLNKWFRQACNEAGLPDTCVPHGLRKALCRRLAQARCSHKLIASISGHMTSKEVDRYIRDFENEQGAIDAFAMLAAAKGGA
jgi:integrase